VKPRLRPGKPIIGLVEKETRADGSYAWVSTAKMPLYDADRIVGTFGLSRDVTPQKLAEDNPMNQRLAQVMLTKAGYQMEAANTGKEAVEKFTAEPERYDLIFKDLHMPELDGLEATKVLRNRGYKDIPIIAMTADAMKEDRDRCLETGMNDYMAKPIRREEVFGMVKKWVFKET
jgi:CheY-like chemotaxis protein